MFKRLLLIAVAIAAFSSLSYSQWTKVKFNSPILDSLQSNSGSEAIQVDPDGNLWFAHYRPVVTDSVLVPGQTAYTQVRPVYVYKPDGTPMPFSPIKILTIGGTPQPLSGSYNLGMNRGPDGNMYLAQTGKIFKINYKTGAGMGYYSQTDFTSLIKPGVDNAGNVYFGCVLPGYAVKILNPDLTYNSNAVDTVQDYARTMEVSKDGNTIYVPRYSGAYVAIYKRASEFDPYKWVDTIKGFKCEAIGWNPINNLLYISSGSYNDMPLQDVTDKTLLYPQCTVGTYYGVDVSKKPFKILDSLSWTYYTPKDVNERNRGISFTTTDGKTAYICEFGSSLAPYQKLTLTGKLPGTSVERTNNNIVENYALSQNYPNPFNPTTTINFSVAKAGHVSLKVYDMLGKEVATLVNEDMAAGNYNTDFNASRLTSGVYIYQLTANGVVLSHKMTLMK